MPFASDEARLTILLGTIIILFFGIAIIALFNIFSKKNQLNQQEKEILKATYDKSILQAQLEIQEQTFTEISQDIHDNVGQVLSLAKVQIHIIKEAANCTNEKLDEVKENISRAMTDLRDIAKGLSTDRIRSIHIYDAVANELERVSKSGVAQTTLVKNGTDIPISEQKKLILFRIIQECIQNSIKHAKAKQIVVSFCNEAEALTVALSDDGCGFDLESALQRKEGLGMLNLKKRALLAGGFAQIESVPGKGTTIQISIPYE